MKRLKDIGMNCGLEYTRYPIYRHLTKPYFRYEHSVGTALIVWHFTQDRAQTIAALLHDISTPVFAHVIDFLNEDHLTQESTEGPTRRVMNSRRNCSGCNSRRTEYGTGVRLSSLSDCG